ncbi:hypothetical protein [Mucilaginibacter pocheonensis]|uniref:HNH endonuclease n=1 Tax=Mucilaginibacter pocheonensis TaxID=398050 RepID=A0ABU1TDK0_9SPHI|nr:hypothetical protein [Mucilaginibacter pocheonensis]MDR6942931.1 hypothetical protein [Mucilaginibacter pocheonensis]
MRSIAIAAVRQVIAEFPNDILKQKTYLEQNLEALIDNDLTDPLEILYAQTIHELSGEIITAIPSILATLKKNFDEIVDASVMESAPFESFRKKIILALGYKHWREVFYPKYFAKLGIKTCVYCNAQATLSIKRKQVPGTTDWVRRAKFQVDHFLAKNSYPCFSISLFNLNPVCASCNNVKSTKKILFELYEDQPGASPFHFYLEKESKGRFLNSRKLDDIVIKVKSDHKATRGFADHIGLFEIEGIYSEYRDVAEELLLKAEVYTPDYKKTLRNTFKDYITSENINRLLTGNYVAEDELHKRPLSKFVRDVSLDLGLIEPANQANH